MRLIGIMPVRNEDWCLGLTLRAALMWCDEVVVLLHHCTDRSSDIAVAVSDEAPGRVHIFRDLSDKWLEMAHRQMLLEAARTHKATHIAIVDADEILTGNLLHRIRFLIECTPDGLVLQLPWIALPRSVDRYLTEGTFGSASRVSMAFQDRTDYCWKARGPEKYDFHHREPFGVAGGYSPLSQEDGGLMHLQFLSERRLRAKQALYQMTEVLRWPGRMSPAELAAMYGRAVYETDPLGFANSQVPTSWWDYPTGKFVTYDFIVTTSGTVAPFPASPDTKRTRADLMIHLIDPPYTDTEPWQEIEVRRLIEEHGRKKFAGLDLFGVDKL